MKAVVDRDVCTGCELCVQTCPEVFSMDGEFAAAIEGPVPKQYEKDAQQAADECPVEAIGIS